MNKEKRRTKVTKATILLADDDQFFCAQLIEYLEYAGYRVIPARDGSEVLDLLKQHYRRVDIVLLDVMMPSGPKMEDCDTFAGFRTGYVVAKMIKENYPRIIIIGISNVRDPEVQDWFTQYGAGFIQKPCQASELMEFIRRVTHKRKVRRKPRCFIVHGHDKETLYELKDYLRNVLGFGSPVVLREQPSLGKTVIEKFEEEADKVDVVFVLLTPDDEVSAKGALNDIKRRARQNVVFEMGFFYAELRRRRGRVILLHKGKLELPSDISGIVYIDITDGIAQAGECIRRELRQWL